ncbi:PREDICTED: subtilisin-like protease SBT3.6 [Ipomoea nil]|uniref:subtilisin-like protease SBT3.6 n=1 Tax=Ipomoea nil TaxID=35883 RepID=UPI000901D700|nr:PREDICTED: subtilisin-like protease SBT3.6 [Ipomoea nil]
MSHKTFTFLLLNIIISVIATLPISLGAPSPEGLEVYIVVTEKPNGDPTTTYVRMLTSLFDSEEAAKKALIYVYQFSVQGFAAKLTPQQAKSLSEYPGVISVEKDQMMSLPPLRDEGNFH